MNGDMNDEFHLSTVDVAGLQIAFFLCRLALVLGLGLRSVFILAISCRPSVCRLSSVCNVRAPCMLSRLKFSAVLLRHLLSWIRLHQRNILRRSSLENPSVGNEGAVKRKRDSQI